MNTFAANVCNTGLTETLEIVLPMLWEVETCSTIHFQYWTGKKNHWKALKNVKMCHFMKCIVCIQKAGNARNIIEKKNLKNR